MRLMPICACLLAMQLQAGLRVERRADQTLGISIDGILTSPAEGLWSIACDWRGDWPSGWVNGGPTVERQAGEWTLLSGKISACGGMFAIEDAYRPAHGVIEARRRFAWLGQNIAPKVTLTVRFQARAEKAQALLPGILYYGNPSGARSGRVPVWNGRAGEEAIFEEHRYPMPFAFLELDRRRGVALHTVPSPVPGGNLPDQWWSMGVVGRDGGAELILLSGPCAANGRRSVIKSMQKTFEPYTSAWLMMKPGMIIEKSFYLETFPVEREGAGFQHPVRTAIDLAGGFDASGEASFAEIIRAKYRYAKTRWFEKDEVAGFRKYVTRPQIVMGWTGQAEALGYALQVLGPGLHDAETAHMARASLDFLSSAPFYEHGFRNWYDPEKREWSGDETLNQGQAMLSFARAIRYARAHGTGCARWEAFLRKAAEFHARRILAAGWNPVSTSDAAFIAPLAMAGELFGYQTDRAAAVKAGDYYAARHLSMREPYWGGTLDAKCEDKEGAAMAFQGFLALYTATQDRKYLEWARHAADVVLTYVVVWNIDMPPGRLRDHAFRTKGWTVVSPQNQHLDVWGTFVAPDLYRLGEIDGREDLKRLALLMYRTCGQLIDAEGSQGEQMQQTNYSQGDQSALRGGYNENWTVFWITTHFLTGAAQFAEMGVPVWE